MKLCFLLVLASQLTFTTARSFLDGEVPVDGTDAAGLKREAAEMASVAAEFKRTTLPDQNRRVADLKAALQPMFKSLPKNEHGNLVPQVARYTLHRLFEQQHSWSLNGLSPVRASKEENQFGQLTADVTAKGISLNNLALLAAILEDHTHKETVSQLEQTYGALHRRTDEGELSADTLDVLVDRYMTLYVAGVREYNLTAAEVAENKKYMETAASDWPATMAWVHEAQQAAMSAEKTFDFQATTSVVEEILKGYGKFNGGECKRLKSTLLEMEDHSTGRLSLANFYKKGMSGTWEFNEKVDYLRDLGTLDESVPGQPRVIVANYVNSWVNCLSSSSLYSVCCRNECDDLMGHLESFFESPTATPRRILEQIQSFQSEDFAVPSHISELLNSRLQNIAEKNHGVVPLHGRLFAQWLHHVFPRSCPYPHTAGATNPLTPDQWMKERGHTAIKASQEEISRVVSTIAVDVKGGIVRDPHSSKEESNEDVAVPWSDVEEVFVIHSSQDVQVDARFSGLDFVIAVAEMFASAAIVYAIVRVARSFRPRGKGFNAPAYEKLAI